MGYDPVRGVNTYGRQCLPGCARQFGWWQREYQAGSLGCYNPASRAGGGPSLHAEGRAMDIALNANDPAQRARGDAIVARVVANPEQFGAQEMLWRGGVWSWRNRHLGWRQNGTQQAAHMNHVHLGLDVNAALNWHEGWVAPVHQPSPAPRSQEHEHMDGIHINGIYHWFYVSSDGALKERWGNPLAPHSTTIIGSGCLPTAKGGQVSVVKDPTEGWYGVSALAADGNRVRSAFWDRTKWLVEA